MAKSRALIIHVEPHQHERVSFLARALGVSRSEFLRDLLDRGARQRFDADPQFRGLYAATSRKSNAQPSPAPHTEDQSNG